MVVTSLGLDTVKAGVNKRRTTFGGSVFRKDEKFRLECGHEGRIVWISSDGRSICVRGVKRSCRTCGKKSSGGWVPIVYLISIDGVEKDE